MRIFGKRKTGKRKPRRRSVEYIAGADVILFRGKKYYLAHLTDLKQTAKRMGKKMMSEGYGVRLLKSMGMWHIYTSSKYKKKIADELMFMRYVRKK